MQPSVLQLFSIGIGPSSSHTVGPMRAAFAFILENSSQIYLIDSVVIELYGSLAMTGIGHATDKAVLLGLEGNLPEQIDPNVVDERVNEIIKNQKLNLLGKKEIPFALDTHLLFHRGKRLPYHSNALRFTAYDAKKNKLSTKLFYSVGGGFIVEHGEIPQTSKRVAKEVPFPFRTYAELLEHCENNHQTIAEIVLENEKTFRSEEETVSGILKIWETMQSCVQRGCSKEGILPGGLQVKRRAFDLHRALSAGNKTPGKLTDPSEIFEWVSLFALAVNEENAAGGRVVTAPTNGACGVIPAVLHYYLYFTPEPTKEGIIRFFLTATAIGTLYKEGASLSAAEMGCQGEIGVACSMAAAGLVAALNGSVAQIENAAEIGMEHHLGLTCDPIGGLVQIPCIERNTMGAVKAINAARLSLRGDGTHRVSLDQVIYAMRLTGEDMKSIYKETSEGGLALCISVGSRNC
jgi:L-serine dehydratase